MALSTTFNSLQTQIDQFIMEAYERIGIMPEMMTGQHIDSATRSGNLLLSEWINNGLNLWTVDIKMLGLTPNQSVYNLPSFISDVEEVSLRTSTRVLGGVAASFPGGIAQNAFDGNPATACTQTGPNGDISYDYGVDNSNLITLVGVQSNVNADYTLVFQYSNDLVTWFPIDFFLDSNGIGNVYPEGVIVWQYLIAPIQARAFRIIEIGGLTLDIQELYFNNGLQDTLLGRISRSEYMSYPQKQQVGRPTTYWIDRKINPKIVIWPVPTDQYNAIVYSQVRIITDFSTLVNQAAIPTRFFEPLVAGLAHKLSLKYAFEKSAPLEAYYTKVFSSAQAEDTEKVPLRITPDYEGTLE